MIFRKLIKEGDFLNESLIFLLESIEYFSHVNEKN